VIECWLAGWLAGSLAHLLILGSLALLHQTLWLAGVEQIEKNK